MPEVKGMPLYVDLNGLAIILLKYSIKSIIFNFSCSTEQKLLRFKSFLTSIPNHISILRLSLVVERSRNISNHLIHPGSMFGGISKTYSVTVIFKKFLSGFHTF